MSVAFSPTRESEANVTTALDLVSIDYSFWMKQALNLAEGGLGYTQPNPMVGAVVLDQAGHLVGQAFHAMAGQAHAETQALQEAGARARGGSLLVTLEPCCHQGRTPPCTRAIIAAGIARVVSPLRDPDPRVDGKGFSELKAAGIEVLLGVEVDAAERLNRHYLHHRRTGRPWVTLKLAMSMDGFTADASGQSRWITSPACRRHAHTLRGTHDAIVVGAETARRDDPTLSLHDAAGLPPRRFVLQGRRPLPRNLKMFEGDHPATTIGVEATTDWTVPKGELDLPDLAATAERMGREDLTSLLVEGGSRIAAAFLRASLVGRVVAYYAPRFLGEGTGALRGISFPIESALELTEVEIETLEAGWVVTGLVGRA